MGYLSLAADIVSWALLIGGGLFVFIGGLGVLRLPDFYTRIHAAGLTDTMGTILILGGALLQVGSILAAVKLAAILVFLLLTGPTATYALANAARRAGQDPDWPARGER
ncbi:MAG TPA: monovalent cation/H(+) antiporter subunit G [Gammaproteobacteria bacterium]|nr:monovalent cation/H(+) antiporter subunit G [Gammaproteobacteria bacterium]